MRCILTTFLVGFATLASQSARIYASDIIFTLDYSTLNVLPSATGQGLRFVSGSYLGQTEAQGFQVYPGYLHINTPNGYSLNKGATYQLDNGYDHNLDLGHKVPFMSAKSVKKYSDAADQKCRTCLLVTQVHYVKHLGHFRPVTGLTFCKKNSLAA